MQFCATFVPVSLRCLLERYAYYFQFLKLRLTDTCVHGATFSVRPTTSGANAFASIYLQKADSLHTVCNVADLEHCNYYWFCSVCH